jgi:hypothetical protein
MAMVRVTLPDGTHVFDYEVNIGHLNGPGPIPADYFEEARRCVEEDNLVTDDMLPRLKFEMLPDGPKG